MKKLKLDLNDLKVESFETNPHFVKRQGTVQGFKTETANTCDEACQATLDSCIVTNCGSTCGATCDATCPATCGDTCDNITCVGCPIDPTKIGVNCDV